MGTYCRIFYDNDFSLSVVGSGILQENSVFALPAAGSPLII